MDAACGQFEFRLAATADQFLTVAKLRAARRLWDQVARQCGASGPARAQRQHAVTSTAMMSRYDPWVNLLRTTVACFGASLGGAEAITVAPHDDLRVPGGTDLSRRLARNVSAVLAEESHLGRVADPAGGSWYVERLTADLAAAYWAVFQDIERGGGIVAALEAGIIADRIDATWASRLKRLAQRRDPLTGVSEFPAIDEEPPPPLQPPAAPDATAFPPLPRRRSTEPFEALRARADAEATTGRRPVVFLAALGSAAAFTARVTFARNLFEVGGIRALVGSGAATPEEAAAAFAASGAPLVCLCSSDAVYAVQAAPTAAALRAGAERIYLAGRPGDQQGDLEAAGVDEFMFVGSDVIDVLDRALDAALSTAGSAP